MRYTLRTATVAAAAVLVLSTGVVQAQDAVTFEKKEPVKIGYSVYDMQQPYWQAYARGVQDAAKAAGAEFALSDQKSSQQTQVSGSMDLINQGISALVVSPVQPPALPAVIDAAHEAKIPVIIGDVGAEGDYDAFVLSDNDGGGKQAAQYMVKRWTTPRHQGSARDRAAPRLGGRRGARDGLHGRDGQARGLQDRGRLNGNDTVEGGYKATQDTLSAHPHLVGIYATNDPEADGAVQALAEAGKNGVKDVFVVGFNGDPPALELIKAGDMAATIRQDPYGQGKAAVEAALTLLDGQPVHVLRRGDQVDLLPGQGRHGENVDQFMDLPSRQRGSRLGEAAQDGGPVRRSTPDRATIDSHQTRKDPWRTHSRGAADHQAVPRRPGARRGRSGAPARRGPRARRREWRGQEHAHQGPRRPASAHVGLAPRGRPRVQFETRMQSQRAGISVINQEFNLIPAADRGRQHLPGPRAPAGGVA